MSFEIKSKDYQGECVKVERQRKTKNPCSNCMLHKDRCICEFIPHLILKTKVTLVIHAKELKRTTNSGTLALRALQNSEMKVRGSGRSKLDLSPLLSSEYQSFLFYPADGAEELNLQLVARSPLPVHLIVPDGNWRQASKIHFRHPELKHIPRVMISDVNLAAHHLRAEHSDHGMSTLEAIARALGIIEGPDVQDQMMVLYRKKLEQTLLGRGISPT
ncbi:MAG TPA: tRNA-uridine aminocarboxypropyltransferase [Bacteriovoracaceae bacterium]|nr:tRNA-uridine aminocarboxypropyltransferase [Bacteriovoracaceae bacterium]